MYAPRGNAVAPYPRLRTSRVSGDISRLRERGARSASAGADADARRLFSFTYADVALDTRRRSCGGVRAHPAFHVPGCLALTATRGRRSGSHYSGRAPVCGSRSGSLSSVRVRGAQGINSTPGRRAPRPDRICTVFDRGGTLCVGTVNGDERTRVRHEATGSTRSRAVVTSTGARDASNMAAVLQHSSVLRPLSMEKIRPSTGLVSSSGSGERSFVESRRV